MDLLETDLTQSLMLDGNAAAGILHEIFDLEMTASPTECAHCGKEGEMATLQAYMEGPGIILRCPTCQSVILRIVQTPEATFVDARGAVYLRLAR